jgi:hypothetical protein
VYLADRDVNRMAVLSLRIRIYFGASLRRALEHLGLEAASLERKRPTSRVSARNPATNLFPTGSAARRSKRTRQPHRLLVVITPCCRPQSLRDVHRSVRFSIVSHWIIVFDAEQVPRADVPRTWLHHPQILLCATTDARSKYGNAQRRFGLQIARTLYEEHDPLIYFLDDDNLVHPAFYDLFRRSMWRRGVFYTFNQRRDWLTCSGRFCARAMMDTAMICLPLSLCPDWQASAVYAEDFRFIRSVMRTYRSRHVHLNQVAAYYNALQPRAVARLIGAQQQRLNAYMACVLIAIAVTVMMLLR